MKKLFLIAFLLISITSVNNAYSQTILYYSSNHSGDDAIFTYTSPSFSVTDTLRYYDLTIYYPTDKTVDRSYLQADNYPYHSIIFTDNEVNPSECSFQRRVYYNVNVDPPLTMEWYIQYDEDDEIYEILTVEVPSSSQSAGFQGGVQIW